MNRPLELSRRPISLRNEGERTHSLATSRREPDRPDERHGGSGGSQPFYFASLEADSHRPEVQRIIAEAIRKGTIRVEPIPGCENRVRIHQTESASAVSAAGD